MTLPVNFPVAGTEASSLKLRGFGLTLRLYLLVTDTSTLAGMPALEGEQGTRLVEW